MTGEPLLRALFAFIVIACGAVASGCGNSATTISPGLCGAPKGPVALAYPAPNSTGIPSNFSGVIFASQNGLSSSYQAFLLPAGSSLFTALQPVATAPTPFPSPFAAPSFSNPDYQTSASGGQILPATTQVGVYLNDGNSTCTASFLGSFTTR